MNKVVTGSVSKSVTAHGIFNRPVYYLKYKGEIDGISVDIEVWPVENQSSEITEYITELSFKEDTYDEAVINRKIVQDVLEKDSILIHEDSLKTQKILNAYLQ